MHTDAKGKTKCGIFASVCIFMQATYLCHSHFGAFWQPSRSLSDILASMSHAELLEIDFNVVLKIKNQSHVNYRSKSSLIMGIYTVCAYVRPVMATTDALSYLTVGQNRTSTYGHRPGQP